MTDELPKLIRGADLKTGDRVRVWFNSGKGAIVVGERPYVGKLDIWNGDRVRIIEFTANTKSGTTEMTVADSALFTVAH